MSCQSAPVGHPASATHQCCPSVPPAVPISAAYQC
ncbi:unnamed protein product, partial [Staurois parvus]